MKNIKFILILTVAKFALASQVIPAQANTFDFYPLTDPAGNSSNSQKNVDRFSVEISQYSELQVLFNFYNNGTDHSVISEIYFDSGPLLDIAGLIDLQNKGHAGVDFVMDGELNTNGKEMKTSPGKLPGRHKLDPYFSADFLIQANNPEPKWGINEGEYLGVIFNLQNGSTFQDVINQLNEGSLRIGMHAKGQSFVNEANTPVQTPIPGSMLFAGTGLLGLWAFKRRRGLLNKSH